MPDLEFLGPYRDRFTAVNLLGSGAFGQVFRAHDRSRGMTVAIKVLKDLRPMHVALFKREFRAVAAISHSSLVQIYDLLTDGEHALFTMEYIEGRPFDAFAAGVEVAAAEPFDSTGETRPPPTSIEADDTADPASTTDPSLTATPDLSLTAAPAMTRTTPPTEQLSMMGPVLRLDTQPSETGPSRAHTGTLPSRSHRRYPICRDHAGLRGTLRKLVRGVMAMHDFGILHRDLKPANVIVDGHGRVVILDFGLVHALSPTADSVDADEALIVGTPNYMSPEQAAGDALTPASDWYSVGVMLYQSLTGQPPFRGTANQILMQRQLADPPPPSAVRPGVPDDLDSLCRALLDRTPSRRPDGPAILEWLGFDAEQPRAHAAPHELPFVGRVAELEQLGQALKDARDGRAVMAFVGGPSGIGKTALVERYVESAWHRGDMLVLRGRCHERENLPFKAVDGVLESLAAYLAALPRARIERLVPPGIDALARLFPTLEQVDAIAEVARRRRPQSPEETRRQALRTFKGLIAALAREEKRTVLMLIDDLQWGDVDGARLLNGLTAPPAAPPLLVMGTYRTEETETSECLQLLLGGDGAYDLDRDVRLVPVGPLSADEAAELATRLAEYETDVGDSTIRAVAREGAGSPLFIAELVRRAGAGGHEASPAGGDGEPIDVRMRLDSLIADRVSALPEATQRLLRVVAIAGRPISRGLLATAAGSSSPEEDGLLRLRADRLVRIRVVDQGEAIEPYHDRIRETVTTLLDAPTRRSIHLRLADALEARADTDPEALARHLQASGQQDRAQTYARLAATRADSALAFDQAARLYRLCLDFGALDTDETRPLQVALADALRNAGRSLDAAEAYLTAAAGAPEKQRLDLIRKASTQFMISGHAERGLELMGGVVEAYGLSMPRSGAHAVLRLIWGRIKLRFRGRGWIERRAADIDPAALERLDLMWDCAMGMSIADELIAGSFQVQHQLLAFETGEPYRIALALGIESMLSAVSGPAKRTRTARLSREARTLALRVGSAHAEALARQVQCDIAWLEGRWADAVADGRASVKIFRERCTGRVWEESLSHLLTLEGLKYSGQWRAMVDDMVTVLLEARGRGDLFIETQLQIRIVPFACIVADQPQRGLDEIVTATARWPRGFHGSGTYDMIGRSVCEFYAGRIDAARARMKAGWNGFRRSMMARLELVDVAVTFLRARIMAAAAAIEAPTAQRRTLKTVRALAARIRRRGSMWADALSQVVDLAADSIEHGPSVHLVDGLHAAEIALTEGDMKHYAQACRWRRGALIGGSRGEALIAEATAWMKAQGARRPDRMVDVLMPGRYDEPVPGMAALPEPEVGTEPPPEPAPEAGPTARLGMADTMAFEAPDLDDPDA